jgi:hypothetical protein
MEESKARVSYSERFQNYQFLALRVSDDGRRRAREMSGIGVLMCMYESGAGLPCVYYSIILSLHETATPWKSTKTTCPELLFDSEAGVLKKLSLACLAKLSRLRHS